MAKKQSMKQQIMQSIANSHVKQAMANIQKDNVQKLQAEFDAWNKQQDEIAALQAEYDAWNQANPVEVQQPVQPVQQTAKKEKKKERPYNSPMEAIEALKAPKEQKQIPSIFDYVKKDEQAAMQPKSISGKNVNKKAAQDIEKNKIERLKDPENLIKEYARQQNISEDEARRRYEMGQKKQAIIAKDDSKIDTLKPYLDTNKKLNKSEIKEAREEARKVLNSIDYQSGNRRAFKSEEDRQKYADAVNLLNKTSKLANFSQGALNPFLRVARNVNNSVNVMGDQLQEGAATVSDALGLTDNAREKAQQDIEQRQNVLDSINASNKAAYENARKQNPALATLGEFAGMAGMYAMTNPLFDEAAAAIGGGSRLGQFAANQAGQNAQDMVLDTLPTLKDYMADGSLSDEEKKDLAQNVGLNVVGNLIPGLIGEGVNAYKGAKAVENIAPDVDNVVRNATRQAEDAAQKIDNIANQMSDRKMTLTEIANTPTDDLSIAHRQVDSGVKGIRNFADLKENNAVKELDKKGKISKILNDYPNIQRISTAPKKSAETILNEKNNFVAQINRFARGEMAQNELFDLGSTPEILKEHGLKGKTIKMTQKIFDKITLPEGYYPGGHGLGREGVEKFIEAFEDPAVIFRSDKGDSLGVVINLGDTKGNPILVPITIGDNGLIKDVDDILGSSKVKSAHIRNRLDNYLSERGSQISFIKGDNEPLDIDFKNVELHDSLSPSSNITDAIENVNKNSLNNDIPSQQKFELPEDVQDKLLSDFEEIYSGLDAMDKAAQASGNPVAVEKFQRLQQAVFDYEQSVWKSESMEDINKAKKASDAARQAFIREMQKTDANYKGTLTGTKLGNAEYRRKEMLKNADNAQATVDAINELENLGKSNNVEGANPLQTFADGSSKEEWKTSKWRTNTAEKTGVIDNPDDIPERDFAYRVFHEIEQHDLARERYKDSKDIAKDLFNVEQFDAVDMKAGMDEWISLMEKGDPTSLKKARRLSRKIAHEGREGARTVQALAEYGRNTAEGQTRFAQNAIDDIVDKKLGTGTSESLDNLVEEINKAFDNSNGNKEAFSDQVSKLLDENLRKYAGSKTAKNMTPKAIKGKDKILKMIDKGADIEEIINQVYKENGGVKLTSEEQKQIYDFLKKAQNATEGSYEQEEYLARAARIAVAKAPSTLGQKIRSILYSNMLGNFKTALSRNAFGNMAYQTLEQGRQPIAAAVDWATSKVTGKHSALGWNKEKAGSYFSGLKKGASEQLKDIAKGIDTGRSGAKGWEQALANNATSFNDTKALGKFANRVSYYVTNAMELGDRPFFEANYKQAYTELEQMLDRYGKNGVAGLEGIKDEDLPAVIDMISSVRAADSVFQKHGKMSKGLTDLRNGLGEMSEGIIGADVLSTAASPFTMTPGNMIERAIEYTPLGFAKNGVETAREVIGKKGFNQRRFVDEASRSIAGIPVLAASYALAKNGGINGGYSEDKDEKAAQQEDGFIEYGLNLPNGKTYDTSDLPVYGPMMQAGAVMAEEGISPASSLQAAEAVLGSSTLQGLRRAFGADNSFGSTSSVENLVDTVKSSGTQLIPSLLRQTAQTTDQYKRDLGEYGTNEYYVNSIKNSLPILRQTLPIKTNVEGIPVLQNQGRPLPEKILENYILPMNVSEYKPSELNKEASRLLKTTDSAIAFVPKAQRSELRGWNEKAGIEYSEDQFREYKQELGTLNSEVGNQIIQSNFYNNLDDRDKAKALQSVYSGMKQIAKQNATGIKTDDKVANAYMNDGAEGVINYLTGKSIVNDAGLSASSKAAKEIQEAVENGQIDKAQKIASSENEKLDTFEKYGVENNSTSRKIYNTYGESGLKDLAALQKEGLDAGATYTYQSAKSDGVQIPSIKDFATTYKKIDSYGNKNGNVSQNEFKAYLKAGKYSVEEAERLAKIYGDWTKTPYINKKGEWSFH